MSKAARARIAALSALGVLGVFAVLRDSARISPRSADRGEQSPPAPDGGDPGEVIRRRLEAARRGDVAGYIACHFGAAARRLEATRREMTNEAFAAYLRDSYSKLKGVAIDQPRWTGSGDAEIRIEYVYGDRNEAQRIRVAERDGRWVIVEFDAAEPVELIAPYGSPVEPR